MSKRPIYRSEEHPSPNFEKAMGFALGALCLLLTVILLMTVGCQSIPDLHPNSRSLMNGQHRELSPAPIQYRELE